jgi:hypothetical protein
MDIEHDETKEIVVRLFSFPFEREGRAPKSEKQSRITSWRQSIPETGRIQAQRYDYL